MAQQWPFLVNEKLFLARTLLERLEQTPNSSAAAMPIAEQKALEQGAIELLLRGRQLLLIAIARLHQNKTAMPASIEQLEALFPYPVAETEQLREFAATAGSWWQHLAELEAALSKPSEATKHKASDNLIAVSADHGPDRSCKALRNSLSAMAQFVRVLTEQHSEY